MRRVCRVRMHPHTTKTYTPHARTHASTEISLPFAKPSFSFLPPSRMLPVVPVRLAQLHLETLTFFGLVKERKIRNPLRASPPSQVPAIL